MKSLLLILLSTIILVILVILYGCVVMASRCSRDEEREVE